MWCCLGMVHVCLAVAWNWILFLTARWYRQYVPPQIKLNQIIYCQCLCIGDFKWFFLFYDWFILLRCNWNVHIFFERPNHNLSDLLKFNLRSNNSNKLVKWTNAWNNERSRKFNLPIKKYWSKTKAHKLFFLFALNAVGRVFFVGFAKNANVHEEKTLIEN